MSHYDIAISALVAQWIGAISTFLAVGVAIVFGWLTLATSRRSKDTQERATITAANEPLSFEFAEAVVEVAKVNWRVEGGGGEQWLLINGGSNAAHDVEVDGLTELDKKRLTVDPTPQTVGPTGAVGFTFVSRFTLSGPGNLVVTFALEAAGPTVQRVVRVPSA